LRTRATHSVHMASSCDTACIRDMLHSYVRYDAFICVTCRNHACDVTWCFHKKNHCLQSVFMCLYLDCVDVSLLLSKRTNRTVRAKQSLCVRIDCNRNLQWYHMQYSPFCIACARLIFLPVCLLIACLYISMHVWMEKKRSYKVPQRFAGKWTGLASSGKKQ